MTHPAIDNRQLAAGLHLFRHRDGYLAFHTESFSLFRLGESFGRLFGGLRRGTPVDRLAAEAGVTPQELDERLAEMRNKIERNAALCEPLPDDPPAEREVGITLHVSNACNLGCLYCYAQGGDYGRKPQRRMDKQLALRAVDRMYEHFPHIRSILFFGGEPLLALDVIEAVCLHLEQRHARGEIARLPEYKTVTNGTLIDEEAVRVVRRHDIRVTISIDGPQQIHDRLRPTKRGAGSYAAARRGFERLAEATGRLPQIEATYTRLHLDAGIGMEELIGFLNREFAFTVGTVANVDLPQDHELAVPTDEAFDDNRSAINHLMMAMAHGELPKIERSFLYPILQFIKKRGTRFTCPVAYSGFDVTTDGEIYPCQVFIGQPGFRLGTVDDFDPERPSAEHQAVRRRLLYADKQASPRCQACWVRPFCTNCPGAEIFSSNDYQVPARYCRGMRRWIENVLATLYEIKRDPLLWANFLAALEKIADEVRDNVASAGSFPEPARSPLPIVAC